MNLGPRALCFTWFLLTVQYVCAEKSDKKSARHNHGDHDEAFCCVRAIPVAACESILCRKKRGGPREEWGFRKLIETSGKKKQGVSRREEGELISIKARYVV